MVSVLPVPALPPTRRKLLSRFTVAPARMAPLLLAPAKPMDKSPDCSVALEIVRLLNAAPLVPMVSTPLEATALPPKRL